ncbi:lipopolysaccharide-induced tumor necrosis factor-alpha factor homolog isoform X2 [Diachasmimorpha longicaudata]|uniref:lipopolysaccharide-induced tumor necrosis factor-alpha factor homolog isoform X2 n=1 Tax=Diachasmimorpha longicaudata TaxID=58733 RepID=UPI0030B8F7C4
MENKQAPPPGFVPPPPYTAGPPHAAAPAPVIMVQHVALGPESQRMACPHCHADISTRVESESNTKTHLFALLLCLIGCWPCAPCPYCMDSCLAKKHYCPACNSYIGQHEN